MWWLPMAVQGVSAVAGYLNKKSANSRMNAALDKAGNLSGAELDYQTKLQSRAKHGDPNMASMQNRILGGVRQQGHFNRQRVQGQVIGQGLENSIVAQELRRGVDSDTMKTIADESRRLAEYNKSYKEKSEDKLDSFNLQRQQKLQSIAMQKAGIQSDSEIAMEGFAGVAGAAASGYADWKAHTPGKDPRVIDFKDNQVMEHGGVKYYRDSNGDIKVFS